MDITEFLKARITEDEAAARAVPPLGHNHDMGGNKQEEQFTFDRWLPNAIDGMGNSSKHRHNPTTETHFSRWTPQRVLAECKAKRAIIELHDQWPVLIQTEPEPLLSFKTNQMESIAFTVTRKIELATNKAYVERFGTQPPTTPMLIAMASIYADHPDFQEAWRA